MPKLVNVAIDFFELLMLFCNDGCRHIKRFGTTERKTSGTLEKIISPSRKQVKEYNQHGRSRCVLTVSSRYRRKQA